MTDFYLDDKKILSIHFCADGYKIEATKLLLDDGSIYLTHNFNFFVKEKLSTDGQEMIITNDS